MHIKRDYSRSFFTERRRSPRNYTRVLFVFGLLIGALLVFVSANFDRLQTQALDMVGMGPTPTPLPGDLASRADQLVANADLEEARGLFEQAIEQRPEDIDYLYEYGDLLIDMDEAGRALELAERIQDITLNDPRGYALKARALVWDGNSSDAIPVALAGLELNAGYEAALHTALARAYTNTGQYEKGVEAGAQAIQAGPSNVDARRAYAYALSWINDREGAIEQLEAAVMLEPSNVPAKMELALQYLAANRDQDAINTYDRVLSIQPRNARALRRLCSTYRKVGQFERALGFCQDAVDANPESVGGWYELGLLQYNNFNFEGARESFANCVDLDESSLACKHRLGLTHYYLDNCDEAWDILQESLLMAQTAQGQGQDVSNTINNIREGLQGVGEKCPQYGGGIVTPEGTPEATPQITPTATDGSSGA